ncbi:hypothetical protein RHGRI_011940 [Rhododendron griersonianum]|uniref:Peptidase C1A papain C-terminal domain-containing protein n=1 Tax=Rhododendron griersonianum TaxID=479676 RepID=A0AAV6KNN6_9ERIC|nr:hypothetical protein RHGRI_011940 [Rhododendron griersonianum]
MGYITINPTVLAETEHFLGADLISVFNSSGCHLSITSDLESNLRHYCYAQVARDVRATDDGDDVDDECDNYEGGIYWSNFASNYTVHEMRLCCLDIWGTEEDETEYWICQNSWGEGFGEGVATPDFVVELHLTAENVEVVWDEIQSYPIADGVNVAHEINGNVVRLQGA